MRYLVMCFVLWQMHAVINIAQAAVMKPRELSAVERRNIAIDFMKNKGWRQTLCQQRNFEPMDDDRETRQ